MSKRYRILVECYETVAADPQENVSQTVVMSGLLEKPVDVFNFGLSHEEQIKLLQSCQDALLKEQMTLIEVDSHYCPNCSDQKLVKYGKRHSDYHDIFTDHLITIGRKRCPECHYEPGSTIKNILGHSLSADLIKLQSELGANYTYRESADLFLAFSRAKRSINNHDRIKPGLTLQVQLSGSGSGV
jgi:hypothetical protein